MRASTTCRWSLSTIVRTVLLLTATTITAHAQTADWRFSIEPASYVLPYESWMQVAARMGDTVMAFWGSTGGDRNGLPWPTFYGQRIVGGNAIGESVRILDDTWFPYKIYLLPTAPRPQHVVFAGARDGLFYLIWNDRRPDSPGVYMMNFDREGRRVSGPVPLWDGPAVGITIFNGATADSMIAVILNIPRVGTEEGYSRIIRADPNGSRIGSDARIDSVHVVGQAPYGSDGGAILFSESGRGRVLRPDGTLDPRIPVIDFRYPFLVLNDSSVIRAETTALSRTRSLFDTTTLYRVWNERLARAVPGAILPAAKADSTLVLRWMEVSLTGIVSAYLYQAPLAGDLTIGSGSASLISSISYDYYPSCNNSVARSDVSMTGIRYNCPGRVDIEFYASATCSRGSSPPGTSFTLSSSVDTAVLATAGPTEWWCGPEGASSVRRISNDTTSSIGLLVDGTELILKAPIFPARLERAQFTPGIVQSHDRVYVSYRDTIGVWAVSLVPWSGDQNPDGVVTSTVIPDIGRLGSAGAGGNWSSGGMWDRSTSVDVSAGIPVVMTYAQRYDSYTELGGPNTFRREVYSVVLPSGFSWRTVTSEVLESGNSYARGRPCIESVSRTQDGVGLHVSYKIGCQASRRTMVSIDTAGRTMYTVRDFLGDHDNVSLVAIDTTQVLVIDGRSVTRYDRGSARNSFTIDSVAGNPRYMSLSPDRFLRYNILAGNDSILSLTVFDLAGVRRAGSEVHLGAPATRTSVVLNDRDSTIILINGTRNGVFATVVTAPDLLYRSPNVRVSHTDDSTGAAVAAVRGDSLYVAWEDFRDGGRDIYGTSAKLPTAWTSRVSSREAITGSLEVYPNPAEQTAAVRIDLAHGTQVTISIIDARGATVRNLEPRWLGAGKHRIELDLRGISTGAYGVIVRSDFGTWFCKGVVAD